MLKYSVKRLLFMILTLFLTTLFVFALLEFVPGDPARIIAGEGATEASLAAIRDEFHLNDPFFVRFFRYIGNLLQGNLGVSYKTRQPIAGAIGSRLPLTMVIAFWGVIVGTLLGLLAGTVSAGAEAVPQPIMEISSAHARDRDRYFFSVFFITFTFRCSFNNITVL